MESAKIPFSSGILRNHHPIHTSAPTAIASITRAHTSSRAQPGTPATPVTISLGSNAWCCTTNQIGTFTASSSECAKRSSISSRTDSTYCATYWLPPTTMLCAATGIVGPSAHNAAKDRPPATATPSTASHQRRPHTNSRKNTAGNGLIATAAPSNIAAHTYRRRPNSNTAAHVSAAFTHSTFARFAAKICG